MNGEGKNQTARPLREVSEESSAAQLEQAALALLNERGVLAGLNLREVADRAAVNRALVYHHFGSREALLRSALRRDFATRMREISEGLPLPFNARIRQLIRTLVRQRGAVQLAMLLVLDAKEPVALSPLREAWTNALLADQQRGDIDTELDVDAFLVLISALGYGYALLRDAFAEDFGLTPVELDWRIDQLMEKILSTSVERASGATTS